MKSLLAPSQTLDMDLDPRLSKTFSVLIATMNRPLAITKLLETVEKQTFLPGELVLVDQSRDDQTKLACDAYTRRVAHKGQVVKYIHQETPSLVKARNRGVDESTGDIICFVDDDLILDPDYFEKIAGYFKDPTVGGVAGNAYVQEELKGLKWQLRKLFMRMFLLSNYDARLTPSTFGYPVYERHITKVMEVDLFSGYSMNFRRELAVRHRSDEWFSGYGFREDVDLTYRISREAKLIIVPDARFVHDVSRVNRLDIFKLKEMQFKNYFYLFNKFRRYGVFSWVLFVYSLTGIVFIDLLEFFCGLNKDKWDRFRANFKAMASMT